MISVNVAASARLLLNLIDDVSKFAVDFV